MSIESNVKEWVKYDNIIKEYESKVKLLKEKEIHLKKIYINMHYKIINQT